MNAAKPTDGQLLLQARHVTKRFDGLLAVNDVSFDIPQGSIVSLIGPNGAGKTTFFNIIAGLYGPTQGSVDVRGKRMIAHAVRAWLEPFLWIGPPVVLGLLATGAYLISGAQGVGVTGWLIALATMVALFLSAVARPPWYQRLIFRLGIFRSARPNEMVAAGLGRTFQNIRLFQNMTAEENVLVGMQTKLNATFIDAMFSTPRIRRQEAASHARASELLELVGLRGRGGELAKNLPYGDQRRLEVARALASEPSLLLLDEPTAGMNPRETTNMMALINKIRGELGITVLLIEHDMKVVMGISDRVTVLDRGEKIAEGTPGEVRRDPKVIEAYLGAERMTVSAAAPTASGRDAADIILRLEAVHTYYGHVHALQGIDIEVRRGEIVTLIGANGAGKTTTLKTISGLLRPRSGVVELDGRDVSMRAPHDLIRDGIGHAPEGRGIFSRLTVLENLQMGGFTRPASEIAEDTDRVMMLFPRLKERANQQGGTLSGGEQQMLAIGRALMSRPRVLLLDEPSLGLSPILVQQIFSIVKEINAEGTTILLVEQNALQALNVADRGYVLQTGNVILSGAASDLITNDAVRRAYLGEG